MKRFSLTGGDLEAAVLDELSTIIQHGGVVILPTETIYGFHAAADRHEAIARIDQIKRRDHDKPFLVLASSIEQAKAAGVVFHDDVEKKLANIWPAPLSVILPTSRAVAAAKGHASLAMRISTLPWLRRLCEIVGPIASTSLNRSGEGAICSTEEIPEEILNSVDAIVDAGHLNGVPSTIVDLTGRSPIVVREGAFTFAQNLWKTL